ncbi:MAG: alpha/beta hydrolase, partial [Rhizobiaceae bacterium]|nr:alpha/beta hydrolase [Rhizobiaceae bacterium]
MTDIKTEPRLQHLVVGSDEARREIAMLIRPASGPAAGPALMWLGGYRSDMSGTKAEELDCLAPGACRKAVE